MKTFNKLILSVILSSIFIGANAQTTVPQIISSSQTWTAAGNPYIVNQNVLVKNGATVRVKPGTIIKSKGNFRIIMETGAGFEAKGTKDSIILMDSINFDFSKGAIGYNFTTNTGSVFSYCHFDGTSMLGISKNINFTDMSLLVSNCLFTDIYYAIAVNSNSFLRVEKTIFEGKKSVYGYAYYPNGLDNELEMDECVVKHSYGLYLPATSSIARSFFYDWVSNSGFIINHVSKKAIFKCNNFLKFKSSIIEMNNHSVNSEVVIVGNTFDSAVNHIEYKVLNQSLIGKFVVKNNNFLDCIQKSIKVQGGTTPGYADTLIFTKNYWGTTSPVVIKAKIWDISNDIAIGGLVDYANFLTGMVNDCIEDESEEYFVGQAAVSVNKIRDAGFSIYPNPANGLVTIQSNNHALKLWKIYNLTGELVLSGDCNGGNTNIDVAAIKTGFYILEVKDGGTFTGNQTLVISR